MFIVTLLEACLTFVRRRCFRALYGAGVGRFRRRPRAPAPDTAPQTTPTPALPVIIHKHYVIGPETPGDATPRPPEQSGAQRTIFAAPQSETLSAWERLADDDEPFDDGEPLDDLPDDVTEQERTEIERFDLNRYRSDYAALSADAAAPLLDRVCQGLYAPGSAFKPAVAAAALTAGIDPAATVNCTGRYGFYSGYQPGCLQYGHGGPVDLRTALEYSCNIFFYDVGRRLGVDLFSAMARQLGLATPTGVEITEAQGRLTWSSDENYQAGLTLMAAIGQGNTAVTPLQLAAYAATLANCGQRPALHFADRAVNAATGETVWQYAPTFTTVSGGEGVFGPIRDGMKRMARTTRVLREAPVACAAKTGSPQLADTLPGGGHYVNSVLIGYAPADDPQIAMAVVLEYGGGGSNAAPILRAVLDAVFGG